MDGFPLDQDQAISFSRLIGTPDCVIYLKIRTDQMKHRLKQRGNFDDTEDSINRRIDRFINETKPMIKKWNAVKIDAGKPVDEVFDLLMEALQKDHALKLCETVQMS